MNLATRTRSVGLLLLPLFATPLVAQSLAAPGSNDATSRVAPAELALERGECRAASEVYLKAAAASKDPRLATRATGVAVECGHLPVAWQAALRWRQIDPENIDALRAAGLIGLELWRIPETQDIFRELLSKPDVEPDRALAELLPLLTGSEQSTAAWRVFAPLVVRETASAETLVALARLGIAADDLARASEIAALARKRAPANAELLQLVAALEAARGNAALAIATATDAAKLDPSEASFAVAEILADLDRNEEAHRELERLLEEPGQRAEAERRLALLALSTGDFDESQRRFAGRLQSSTNPAEALFYLALIAERRGDSDLALASYRRLIEAGAGMAPRTRAAAILIRKERRDEGLDLLDDYARRNRGESVDVAVAKAQLLSDAGAHVEAVGLIDAALARHPEHPHLRYQRAMALERGGRTREAVRDFEALLRARPEDPTVLNALGYTLSDRRLQLPRAEQLIRRAVAVRPDSAAFLDSLGWVLYRRGNPRAAVPILERAWMLSHDAEIAAHWGEVLWAAGSEAEARTVWARALARSPDSKPLSETIARLTGKPRGKESAEP